MLKIGTRGSALALAQSALVAEMLRPHLGDEPVEVVPIRTADDQRGDHAPPGGGPDDKSRFVKEIEAALVAQSVDVGVHSAKDVPGELPSGLAIVAVPPRADARDALCGAPSLEALPEAASVGTSSLRRRAQLLAHRPDLRVEDLRGNVDTRLEWLAEGRHDAIVLAAAGLARLGIDGGDPMPATEMTPAPGQGSLVLEARDDDERTASIASRATDGDSLVRLTAERALVHELEASCRTPIGAHAELADGELTLTAFAGLPDGSQWIRDVVTADAGDPVALGRLAAERLLAAGAAELLAAAEEASL